MFPLKINKDIWLKSVGFSSKRDQGIEEIIREDRDKITTTIVSSGEIVIVYEDDYTNLTSQSYEWVIGSVSHFMLPHVKMGNQRVSKVNYWHC